VALLNNNHSLTQNQVLVILSPEINVSLAAVGDDKVEVLKKKFQ